MKNRYSIICLAIFFLLISCVKKEVVVIGSEKYRDSSLASVLVKGKLKIGVSDEYPPFVFRDEEEKLIGYDVDLVCEVARRIGIDVEFKIFAFSKLEENLLQKNIDCIWSGYQRTTGNRDRFALSDGYVRTAGVFLLHVDSPVTCIEELKDSRLSVPQGNSLDVTLPSLQKKYRGFYNVTAHKDLSSCFYALQHGETTAVLSDLLTAAEFSKKQPGIVKMLDEPVSEISYVIAFRKGDAALKQAIETVLFEMYKDRTLARITKKWFDADLSVFGK